MVELEGKSASRLTVDRFGARLDGINVFAERSARQLVDFLHMNWLLLHLSPVIAPLVTARAHSTFGEALDMDVAYARSWSLGLDLRLLCKTPLGLLRRCTG